MLVAPAIAELFLSKRSQPSSGQPDRAKDNSPAIYRWVFGRNENESRQGRKNIGETARGFFFRPCGAWTDLWPLIPAMNRWAIVGRPCGTCRAPLSFGTIAQL